MSGTNNNDDDSGRKKNKKSSNNIEYTGYENMSAFTACLSCDNTVFVPLGQQKAFCKRCGTLTAIRMHKSDEDIASDTITMLDLRLYN